VCVNRSTSFVSYRQCVRCVAEAVVGLLYLKSHCTTTIGVVGLEPKATLFVLILTIARSSFVFFSYLPVWLLVALAPMYGTDGTSCTSGMAKRRKTAVHSVSLQLAERSLPLAAGTSVVERASVAIPARVPCLAQREDRGPRTQRLHIKGCGANRPRKCYASRLREGHVYVRVKCCRR